MTTKTPTTDGGIFVFGTSGREYTLTKTRQGWQYAELKKVNGKLIRVYIERQTYEQQCHAQVDVWTEVGWKTIHSEPLTSLPAISIFAYSKFEDLNTDLFISTADTLLLHSEAYI